MGAVLSAPTHLRQRLISEEAVHPSASPHQGSAMRAMAGFTDVVWSTTTPILAHADSLLPAGWGGALGAAERAGRWNPRSLRTGGGRAVHTTRPSCGACEISRCAPARATHLCSCSSTNMPPTPLSLILPIHPIFRR
ncbi:hypothetical protein [Paramuribaculum intestinale]|uniref:hypothetical protein n=1 Tax=Paramuribaculum intestinale TaxID=2094151 RepID=UPI0025B62013|nr:hypothetical protein [Paramuribaculum intestinale]